MKKQIILGSFLAITSLGFGQTWSTTGNIGTTPTSNYIGTSDNQSLVIKTSGVERMRILNNTSPYSGNIGINNANPIHRLSVAGAIAFNSHLVSRTEHAYINWGNAGSGDLSFRTLATVEQIGGYTDRMIIKNNGKVGIGTVSPTQPLEVSTSEQNSGIQVTQTGSGGAGLWLNNQTSGGHNYFLTSTGVANTEGAGNFAIYDAHPSVNSTRFFIKGNGNVGIGTTNPLAGLHVSSRALIGGATSSNISAGPNVQLGVYQNSPIGIGQCVELRSNTTNAINTLLICDRDDEYAIQVNKFMNPGYQTNFQVMANGKTIIGNQTQVAPHNDALLTVNGKIVSKSLYVRPGGWGWPDFVFDENYIVPNLYDIEKYYKLNKHLPDVPSALDVEEKGIEVAEMNKLLLQKLEEMTILMVKMQKEIDALKQK